MNRFNRIARIAVKAILIIAMAGMVWFGTHYKTIVVDGPSMEPTLLEGDYVICKFYGNKTTNGGNVPKTGDVVIVDPSREKYSKGLIVKRIGEVKDDGYMVYGDNRDESIDSREFGAVSRSEIVGKVIYRVFPIESAGSIK